MGREGLQGNRQETCLCSLGPAGDLFSRRWRAGSGSPKEWSLHLGAALIRNVPSRQALEEEVARGTDLGWGWRVFAEA